MHLTKLTIHILLHFLGLIYRYQLCRNRLINKKPVKCFCLFVLTEMEEMFDSFLCKVESGAEEILQIKPLDSDIWKEVESFPTGPWNDLDRSQIYSEYLNIFVPHNDPWPNWLVFPTTGWTKWTTKVRTVYVTTVLLHKRPKPFCSDSCRIIWPSELKRFSESGVKLVGSGAARWSFIKDTNRSIERW